MQSPLRLRVCLAWHSVLFDEDCDMSASRAPCCTAWSTRACLEVRSLGPHQKAVFILPLLCPQELAEKSRIPSPFCWPPRFYVSLRRLGGSSKVRTGLPLPKRACMKHSVPMIPLSTHRDASLMPPRFHPTANLCPLLVIF